MQWIEIKRDKNGFATEECLNEMFKHELIVVRRYSKIFRRIVYNVFEKRYMDEIKILEHFTHYLPIPKVKL